MKKFLKFLFVLALIVLIIYAGAQVMRHFGWTYNTPEVNIVEPTEIKFNPNCAEATLVPGSQNAGRVELNLDNGDSHSWSVTVINPDSPSGENTLVVITEQLWSFDVVYPVMFFQSARYDGTQEEVVCSAMKLSEGAGELYVYAGEKAPEGWSFADAAVGPWWTEMTVWEYEAEAIDAGVAVEHFIGATDEENRVVFAQADSLEDNFTVSHAQLWRPGYPGKVVHPQVAEGYTLTVPVSWEGTWWSYALPDENIQARIIEATEKEVLPRDQIGTVILLFCGPSYSIPSTSFEFNGQTVSWVVTEDEGETWFFDSDLVEVYLPGWTCTGPAK